MAELRNPYQEAYDDGLYARGAKKVTRGNKIYKEAERNMSNAAIGFDAELALMEAQEYYNSPAHQSMLMRQAGLNPDLQDISFQGNSGDSPDISPTATGETADQFVVESLTTVMQYIPKLIEQIYGYNLAQSELVSRSLINDGKRIQNDLDSQRLDIGKVTLENLGKQSKILDSNLRTSEFEYTDRLRRTVNDTISTVAGRSIYDYWNSGSDFPTFSYRNLGYSEDDAKIMDDYFHTLVKNKEPFLVDSVYKKFGDSEKSRVEYNKTVGDINWRSSDEAMQEVYSKLSGDALRLYQLNVKYLTKYWELKNPGLKARSENQADMANWYGSLYQGSYYRDLNGSLAADAANARNSYESSMYQGLDPDITAQFENAQKRYLALKYQYATDVNQVFYEEMKWMNEQAHNGRIDQKLTAFIVGAISNTAGSVLGSIGALLK